MTLRQFFPLIAFFLVTLPSFGWAKGYKLSTQDSVDTTVHMRDPIMPGETVKEKESEETQQPKAKGKTKRRATALPRKLPKHTKTETAAQMELPGQLKFTTYAIGGRLDQPRVEFSLEPLPLPTSEEPVQIDAKQKLRDMASQKELGL